MTWSMDSWRAWLFRGLVAVAASLMILSFIMPWWNADISEESYMGPIATIKIYSYGIPPGPGSENWATDVTPFYQTVLAWVYIAASAGLILFSTWLKGRKGSWLLGGIGLIYIAYAAIAVFVVIAGRLGELGISLQGHSVVHVGEVMPGDIYASLRLGYYLAYGAGLMCIALALLRNIIVGRPKLGA